MQTKAQAVTSIVASVEAFLGVTLTDETRLTAMVNHYYDMAAGITGYPVLPDALLPFVRTASIRAWQRRGAEVTSRFTGIGVTEAYIDIEADLRKQVMKMKNPLAPVVIPPEEDSDDEPDGQDDGGDPEPEQPADPDPEPDQNQEGQDNEG